MTAQILTAICLLGAAQGLVLAAALAAGREREGAAARRVLAGLLTGGAAAVVVIALSHLPRVVDPRGFELVETALGLVMPPLSLLYVRLVLPERARPLGATLHFLPAIAWLAVAAGQGLAYGVRGIWLPPVRLIVLYQMVYTVVAGTRLARGWSADRPRGAERFWAGAWLALLVAVHAAQLVRIAFAPVALLRDVVPLTLAGGFFTLTFLGFRHSSLFGAARVARRAAAAAAPPRLQEIAAAVRGLLERDKRYLDPELTLTAVADELGLPRGQVSRAVNQSLAAPFLELVNAYRIEEAKRLLGDRAFDHLTIEAVARRAGFASRSAFYEAFRRHTGMTPSEARGARSAPG